MSDKKVFVSDHPDVLAALEEWHAAWKEFHDALPAIKQRFGGRDLHGWSGDGIFTGRTCGISALPGDETKAPTGWRYDKRREMLVPNERTKTGKGLALELSAIVQPDPFKFLKPFTPTSCFAGGMPMTPGVIEMDGKIYMTWNAKATFEGNEYFKPCKLSEFYAAKEAKEAADAEHT